MNDEVELGGNSSKRSQSGTIYDSGLWKKYLFEKNEKRAVELYSLHVTAVSSPFREINDYTHGFPRISKSVTKTGTRKLKDTEYFFRPNKIRKQNSRIVRMHLIFRE